MRAGLGVGVGMFGQIWERVDKGGQVLMGQTDRAGMGDMGGQGFMRPLLVTTVFW